MTGSTQHILDQVRPPRVQITYDVEIGNAIQKKELPFVIGIIADLAGSSLMPKMKDRKFIEIDRDNINAILSRVSPSITYEVENTINPGDKTLGVSLKMTSMDDFDPVSVVKQIPVLNDLYNTRTKLRDLAAKLEGNDALQNILHDCLLNQDLLTSLKKQINDKVKANSSAAGKLNPKNPAPNA